MEGLNVIRIEEDPVPKAAWPSIKNPAIKTAMFSTAERTEVLFNEIVGRVRAARVQCDFKEDEKLQLLLSGSSSELAMVFTPNYGLVCDLTNTTGWDGQLTDTVKMVHEIETMKLAVFLKRNSK